MRLFRRFLSALWEERAIFVAHRGMVSEKNLSLIENEGYGYMVGVKMRGLKKVEDNLRGKESILDDARYIICSDPCEAEKDTRKQVTANPLISRSILAHLQSKKAGLSSFFVETFTKDTYFILALPFCPIHSLISLLNYVFSYPILSDSYANSYPIRGE